MPDPDDEPPTSRSWTDELVRLLYAARMSDRPQYWRDHSAILQVAVETMTEFEVFAQPLDVTLDGLELLLEVAEITHEETGRDPYGIIFQAYRRLGERR